MKIEETTVKRITIRDVKNLDPITVFLEDFGPGQGRAVIECFGNSWAHYWPAMGDEKIIDFLIECDLDYIMGKFASQVRREIPVDSEAEMRKAMKNEIIHRRLDLDFITKKKARELWRKVELAFETIGNNDLMYDVFGDDWWEYQPTQPNPQYQYIERIMKVVRDGLKQYKDEQG